MIKEGKNIDFYTTGRQPSEQDFARISELIKKEKGKKKKGDTQQELGKNIPSTPALLKH